MCLPQLIYIVALWPYFSFTFYLTGLVTVTLNFSKQEPFYFIHLRIYQVSDNSNVSINNNVLINISKLYIFYTKYNKTFQCDLK